jgi:urease accessory protein
MQDFGLSDGSDSPPTPRAGLQRARGTGHVAVTAQRGRTVLDGLYQEGCAKIRLPRTHRASLEAVLINTAGGLCGGDGVCWRAEAAPDTRLVMTTPACERVYRTTAEAAAMAIEIAVGDGARVDWLPQETILFERARLVRRLAVELADSASFLGVEAVVLGRSAMGEAARRAALTDSWRITSAGRLIHAEETRLGGHDAERDAPSLLAGAGAFATLIYVGPEADRLLGAVRAALGDRAGASVIGRKLVLRVAAESGLMLRRTVIPALEALCGADTLPRLWHM